MAAEARSGGRIGPYELLAPVGAGGMGEVWKARDTRFHRYKVGSSETPVKISENCNASSSGASQILCANQKGISMISLDGSTVRQISTEPVWTAGLSRDEKTIYALRQVGEKQEFMRVDVPSGRSQVISTLTELMEFRGPLGGLTRLAISTDEKSIVVTVRSNEGDVWMLDGFQPKRSLWESLWPPKQ